MRKEFRQYMRRHNATTLKDTPLKIVGKKHLLFIQIIAFLAIILIGIAFITTSAFGLLPEKIKSSIPKITVELKVSDETLQQIKNYVNETIEEMKGG